MDQGVTLTPGQAAGAGSMLKRGEEYASSLPVAGHFIRNAQNRAVEEANVAAAQQVARMVDGNIKLGKPPREAIEQTREAIGEAYEKGLAGINVPGFVPDAHLNKVVQSVASQHPMMETVTGCPDGPLRIRSVERDDQQQRWHPDRSDAEAAG